MAGVMHLNKKYRVISASLLVLLAATFIGMWAIYLFVATPEAQTKYESAMELFLYSISPENEGALFFQVTLFTIVFSIALAWMALKNRGLNLLIGLGVINVSVALFLYQWDSIILAVGAVVPLLVEARNA